MSLVICLVLLSVIISNFVFLMLVVLSKFGWVVLLKKLWILICLSVLSCL